MLSILLSLILAVGPPPNAPDKAHCGKSGATVFLVSRTPLGARETPPAVVTTPTLSVNGQAVPIANGPVSGGFWAFSLAKPINPADSLRVTAPEGWSPGMPVLDLAVRNSAGRIEFPVPERPTMGLGVNITNGIPHPGAPFWPAKNWARRLYPWSYFATAYDAAGWPTTLNEPKVSVPFWMGSFGNGIDDQGMPAPIGLWSVVYDSPDPKTELGIEAWRGLTATPRPDLSSPGVAGVGITRVFGVAAPQGAKAGAAWLSLTVGHPNSRPTFTNLWIIGPGNNLDRSDPLAMDEWFRGRLSFGAGKGPTVLRFMDSCSPPSGTSNMVHAADLKSVDRVNWCTNANDDTISGKVLRVRPVDTTASPTLRTIYGDLPYTKDVWHTGSVVIAEVVTDGPHGLSTGQGLWADLGPDVTLSIEGRPTPVRWIGKTAWVTSPTTYIASVPFVQSAGGVVSLDAPVETPAATYSYSASAANLLPYECAAHWAEQLGSILWVSIPHAAADDLVDEIARRCLKSKCKVIYEYANENWNFDDQNSYCSGMGLLLGIAKTGWGDEFSARRQAEITARAAAVYSREGRAGDVLMVLASQFGNMNRGLLDWAGDHGIKADVVSGAPYFDLNPALAKAANDWSPAMVHDLFRAQLVYDPWSKQFWDDWKTAVDRYESKIGKRVLRFTYEGGTEEVSAGMSNAAARTWDIFGDSGAADTERVLYAQAQASGIDVFTYYTFSFAPKNGYDWSLWSWPGQQEGTGDGSDGRPANRPIGASGVWQPGVSVRGHAWREWQRSYLLSR